MKFKYRQQKPKILEDLLKKEKEKEIIKQTIDYAKHKTKCSLNKPNKIKELTTRKQKENMVIDDGKYKFYIKNYSIYCDRYGEPWRNFIGDNAVLTLFHKVLEQSKIIDNLRLLIKEKILKGK